MRIYNHGIRLEDKGMIDKDINAYFIDTGARKQAKEIPRKYYRCLHWNGNLFQEGKIYAGSKTNPCTIDFIDASGYTNTFDVGVTGKWEVVEYSEWLAQEVTRKLQPIDNWTEALRKLGEVAQQLADENKLTLQNCEYIKCVLPNATCKKGDILKLLRKGKLTAIVNKIPGQSMYYIINPKDFIPATEKEFFNRQNRSNEPS